MKRIAAGTAAAVIGLALSWGPATLADAGHRGNDWEVKSHTVVAKKGNDWEVKPLAKRGNDWE